jgi:DNA-binding NarL/FixJ family response regulator
MDRRIRVLLVDDHGYARRGLRALLATCPTVEVVCEAQDGLEAMQLIERSQPDVVLMDIQMPTCDGLEATRSIKAQWPDVRVIALTANSIHQAAALSAGADTFLLKGCPTAELFAAIQGGEAAQKNAQAADGTGGASAPGQRGTELRPTGLAASALAV